MPGVEELDEHLAFQRHARVVGHVLTVAGVLVLAGAALGLMGGGPLSKGTARAHAGLTVGYQRFARLGASTEVDVRLGGARKEGAIAINRDFLDAYQVTTVVPDPQQVSAGPRRTVFTFARRPPAQATFTLQPERAGIHHGVVDGPDGHVSLRQVVYP
jgi:hypothetical protein